MGDLVNLANFRQEQHAKLANELATKLVGKLNEAIGLMNQVRYLPTVEQREQAVIKSSDLMMEAHDMAAKLGIRIRETEGQFHFERIEEGKNNG